MKITFVILFLAVSSNLFGAETNDDHLMPPMPPSPVEEFRNWLRLPKAERMAAMAKRSPDKQVVLLGKLDEYERMPARERNRRLSAMELQWYLRPLMTNSPAQRVRSLELIPVKWKPTIEERLREWDNVPANLQREILKNKTNALYVSNPQPEPPLPMARELKSFFNTSPEKLEKAFTPGEREEMLSTLQAFRDLPEADRQQAINAFSKFAAMSATEQKAFLENVNRWQAMSAEDRDQWRRIVTALPPMPPLPPGLGDPPMPKL